MKDRCKIQDCEKTLNARGYCKHHYDELYRSGKLIVLFPHRNKCEKRGCGEGHYSNGLCRSHYDVMHKAVNPLYSTWTGMKQRCNNPNAKFYSYYGGRGIKVCDRWSNSYKLFESDMGIRPEGSTLDRIDNNGNYEPGNCRWATKSEQSQNCRVRVNNTSGFTGVYKVGKRWVAKRSINGEKMHFGTHDCIEDAVAAIESFKAKGLIYTPPPLKSERR